MLITADVEYYERVLAKALEFRDGKHCNGLNLTDDEVDTQKELGLKAYKSFKNNIRYLHTYSCHVDMDSYAESLSNVNLVAPWLCKARVIANAMHRGQPVPKEAIDWSRCLVVLQPDRGLSFDVSWWWRDKNAPPLGSRSRMYNLYIGVQRDGVRAIPASYRRWMTGGLIFDSGAGESLAVRLVGSVGWQLHT